MAGPVATDAVMRIEFRAKGGTVVMTVNKTVEVVLTHAQEGAARTALFRAAEARRRAMRKLAEAVERERERDTQD